MIKSVTVTNYLGDSFTFDLARPGLSSGFAIGDISGLGPVKANINTSTTASGDGTIFNSARLESRNIVLTLIFLDEYGMSIEEMRHLTYKYFPQKKNIDIVITTDTRQAKITGYVESNSPTIFSKNQGTSISIICPDPYFYSEDINTTVFSGIAPIFEFPFSNESLTMDLIECGAILTKNEEVITYDGDADIGISILIHAIGDASGVSIYNIRTGEVIKLNSSKLAAIVGGDIKASDDIIITTTRGRKSITLLRDGVTYNILNCLEKGSKWFTISKGDNIFAYTAEVGSSNLQFRITNQIIYEGV